MKEAPVCVVTQAGAFRSGAESCPLLGESEQEVYILLPIGAQILLEFGAIR